MLSRERRAQLMLVAVTVVWGLTFALVKESLDELGPFVFMSYRFLLAFLVMAAVSAGRPRSADRGLLKAGAFLGVLLFASYALQTFGLKYTTAGNAGFITGLFAVFTPILSVVILKRAPDLKSVVAVIIAIAGLGVLSLRPNFTINLGDALVLGCAFSYSLHIIFLDGYVKRYDLVLLTLVQMGVLAALNTGSGLVFESFRVPQAGVTWTAIIVCGVLASALAFYVQGYAQRFISPVRTSMTLIMEPVFSVLFGYIILGETLTWRGWLGCSLMFAGMVLAEIRPRRGKRLGTEEAEPASEPGR